MNIIAQEARKRQAVVKLSLRKGKSFASRIYGVSLASVKRWCKRYDGTWKSFRNEKYQHAIGDIFKQIEKEYFNTDKFSKDIVVGLMQQMLSIIYRSENSYENSKRQNHYVEKALEIINRDFAADISLSSLAEEFSISPEHFSHVFKKETGLGSTSIFRYCVLKRLKPLLNRTKKQAFPKSLFRAVLTTATISAKNSRKSTGFLR